MIWGKSEWREERLDRLQRWTEIPLTVLAIVLAAILITPHVSSVSASTREAFDLIDGLIWGIFVADYLVKLAIAPRRFAYVKTHWFDLILIAIPFARPIRALRAFRSLRILNLARVVAAAARMSFVVRLILRRHGLRYVLLTALLVIIVAGALATAVERDRPDATIHSFSDGLWWATTTVTTVGYGDTFPKTAAGRGIGVALMILGITLFSTITANLAAFFVEEDENTMLKKLDDLSNEFRDLREFLASTTYADAAHEPRE